MWLKFGVAPSGELASIDEVARGKTNLACLYCGGELTAKKGAVKEHHFAHTGETCKPVSHRMLLSTCWDCGNTGGMWSCTSSIGTKLLTFALAR
ncbi:hypothetical protein OSCI_1460007 [Kamptonema sp. PCC 6506]|nr:hypothetical protein OSCI_1460007 [Kamptonema sp. PCC 6506]